MPENEEWKVYYITNYKEEMSLRCDINEAYDTQAGECVNPNKRRLYECDTDSDCYIPPGCEGLTATCAANHTCQYEGSCVMKPQEGTGGLWEQILDNAFFRWLQNLWI